MTERERERPLEATEWAEGSRAAGYLLERRLGRGAHAEVFCALEEETGQRVALKLPFRGDGKARVWRRRFIEELELSRRLRHPNLVELFEVRALADGWPVLVMEYVRGVTLHHVLESQAPLSLRHVAGLAMTVSQALHHLHQVGAIRCDVTPTNIMFTRTPRGELTFKLLDLGVATAAPLGEPAAAPPAAEPSDIYSLGAVLWWALTGVHWRQPRLPLQGTPPNTTALDLRRARPEVPGAIAQLIQRMLADAADVRPRPQQIHQVMHHWLRELPKDAPPARLPPREGAAPPPKETLPGAPRPVKELRAPHPAPSTLAPELTAQAPTAERLVVLRVSSPEASAWRAAFDAAQSALIQSVRVELYLTPEALRGLSKPAGAASSWAVRRKNALWARPAPPRQSAAPLRARLAALLDAGLIVAALCEELPAALPTGVASAPPSRWAERVAEATVHLTFSS